jgi:predicted DNA-binding antitoxin AbrB/MazE fold protein
MILRLEATFENGVFVPAQRPTLAEHERVRLTVEQVAELPERREMVRQRRGERIRLDSGLAQEIAGFGIGR